MRYDNVRVTLKRSKRAGLHAGYGAVIAVLVLSAVEAYRIQVGVSRQHLEIYRHFVEQDEALATLRRNVWLVGNRVRDFFIDSTAAQGELLRGQLSASQTENEAALRALSTHPGHQSVVPQLRKSLDEFWAVLDPLPRTMMHPTARQAMEFLQREVVPRRGELYNALRELTFADQRTLQDSEGEFAAARRRAAERLLLMLSLGVLLSVLVAGLSIRHAESLEHKAERHYAEVEEARHELQQLSARLLEIEEEGRRRLSRELHDEIGQTLALLQIEISHIAALATAPPAALRARLDRARDLAERTVADDSQHLPATTPGAAGRPWTGTRAAISTRGVPAPQRRSMRFHRRRRSRSTARCRKDLRLPRGSGSAAQLRKARRRDAGAGLRAPVSGPPGG